MDSCSIGTSSNASRAPHGQIGAKFGLWIVHSSPARSINQLFPSFSREFRSPYPRIRLSCFRLPVVALLTAGLGFGLASPSLAAEANRAWNQDESRRAGQHRVAYLPQLPAAPRTFAITPERRALLNTIRYAEGTWANGHQRGYWIMFGGSMMDSLDRHPNKVNSTARYSSAAAGAYQFMPFTWQRVQRAMNLRGFYPDVQDQAAIFLIQLRKALPLADRGELTPELAARLAPEWASFPTLAGNSYYGQPVKKFHDLKRFYQANLARLRAEEQQRQWEEVAIRTIPSIPSCNDDSLECQLEKTAGASTDR